MDPAVSSVYSVRWEKPGTDDGSDWIFVVLLAIAALGGLYLYAQKPKP